MASHKKLMTLKKATKYASFVYIHFVEAETKIETCGSIRRLQPKVRDVDMVVDCNLGFFHYHLYEISENGKDPEYRLLTKRSPAAAAKLDFTLDGIPFNVYKATEENWGAMVLFLTGSQLFNILMRGEAKKQGYKLSQYGLFHGSEIIAGKTEKQIFEALGLEYVLPCDREVDNKFKFRRV